MEQMLLDRPVTSSSSPAHHDPPGAGADRGTDQLVWTSKHTPQLPFVPHAQIELQLYQHLKRAVFLLCSISVSEAIKKKKQCGLAFPRLTRRFTQRTAEMRTGSLKGNQSLARFVKVERTK